MGVRRMLLRRAVRFLRSPRGQRLLTRARSRVDTPANRAQLERQVARVWRKVDTPANQARLAEAVRRLRAVGTADR